MLDIFISLFLAPLVVKLVTELIKRWLNKYHSCQL